MTAGQDAGDRQQPQVQPCRYKVGKVLGAGSYSVVKECIHIDTGRYYAAKVINKRLMAGREHMVRNEIAVLKKVSMGHQNILTLVDYFETMNNLYLVTDLALGGELFDRICRKGSYYESDAADLIRAVLSAVAYLHDHGIVHRDLKPENLLFRTPEDNADLLIADFGLSRIMDEEQFHVLTTTCGTPGYMAPEIFKKTGHGKPVDLWALGVITYFLLCGYTPFDRDSDFEEMQAILNADYSFTPIEYWRGVSDSAKDFIRRCLTIDPAKRMTAHEALQHPFVAGWARLAAAGGEGADRGTNLLPVVKKNFNARRTLHAAIDTVRAINKLREGQAGGFMNGGRSREPARGNNNNTPAAGQQQDQNPTSSPTPNNNNEPAYHQQQSRKDDAGSKDSGYATTSTTAEDSVPAPVADGDVRMDDAPPPPPPSGTQAQHFGAGEPAAWYPASLRPGSEANRVVETSKGLWNGVGSRR
ncbi:kinase-like domain-containing protein [Staphylotrichum tortipilum]|uniref:Kinase-like domain-containing protein n=1 Tax=Staphylotrichum tortipilum TaxID=2831512 RepID=A0AAN6MG25_9PEZI|nr:kinase-like domain-containing protein [Staphylotrichum longicolle]